jgi:hypothetical protein
VRRASILFVVLLAATIAAGASHRWLALAWNAWRYPTAAPADRTQIVIANQRAYVAAGVDGIEVLDLASTRRVSLLPPTAPADQIDDVAAADGWLFALDATSPGFLLVYSLANPDQPELVGQIVPVPVGPFSGVSAAAGVIAVSGGTSQLTLREYDTAGRLGSNVVTADFGRGQPDIALRSDGKLAAISTHSFGPNFSMTLVEIRRAPLRLQATGQVDLPLAGFTAGGYKPAHFPLVSAWRGDRLFVAHGGGLSVIDVTDPQQPRVLADDPQAHPAMDIAVAAETLDLVRAGANPAILRYRLDRDELPVLIAIHSLASGSKPGAIGSDGAYTLITLLPQGWQFVPPADFSAVPKS